MNKENLQLMSTMLGEVIDGTWKGTPVDHKLVLGPLKMFPENVKHFNLENWVEMETNEQGKNCGYSACAVGHACFDPRFQALGLSMKPGHETPMFFDKGVYFHQWGAVSTLFGISIDQARVLFLERSYDGYTKHGVKPGQVKSRIDELLHIGIEEFTKQYQAVIDSDNNKQMVTE